MFGISGLGGILCGFQSCHLQMCICSSYHSENPISVSFTQNWTQRQEFPTQRSHREKSIEEIFPPTAASADQQNVMQPWNRFVTFWAKSFQQSQISVTKASVLDMSVTDDEWITIQFHLQRGFNWNRAETLGLTWTYWHQPSQHSFK